MKLEDGKGTGTLAEVDGDQRLQVASISSDRAESANFDKESFVLSTNKFSIGAGVEYRVAYISNGEASRDMVIDLERFYTDGGSTSNTKPITFRCYVNASVPTTNSVAKDPIGTNTSAGQSSADFVVWDGVSTGMVQVSAGDKMGDGIITIGNTDARLPSKLILGPAKTMTYSFECAEAAEVSLQIYIHLV